MSAANAPTPQVQQKPTEAQMMLATEHFTGPTGQLKAFADAGLALYRAVELALYTPEHLAYRREENTRIYEIGLPPREGAVHQIYATDSPYPGLTPEQLHDLLIDHTGLSGEFANGIGFAGNYLLNDRNKPEKLKKGLTTLTAFLDYPSQLTSTRPQVAAAIGITQETNREALTRVARQIERWVDFNRDAGKIAPIREGAIEYALAAYQEKLADVLKFADKAKAYTETGIESPARVQQK